MLKLVSIFLLFLSSLGLYAQSLSNDEKAQITLFIEAIQTKDLNKLMPFIAFPIERTYPVPDIENKTEFIARYSEIFDDSISTLISNSDIEKDWQKVGWRGIMLNSGDIWLDEYSWTIKRINVQSRAERENRKAMIEQEKKTIHKSLKVFEIPSMVLATDKNLIRIDELKNGTFRFASWPTGAAMNLKPDLIIKNGIIENHGSGGNYEFRFKKRKTLYVCQINQLGTEETSPANLLILQNDIEISLVPAEIIHN